MQIRLRCDPFDVLMQRKASIEAKNEAETQIYSAESSLREYKDKLPQSVVDNINTEISNVRSSLESEDAEEIRSKVSTAKSGLAFSLLLCVKSITTLILWHLLQYMQAAM